TVSGGTAVAFDVAANHQLTLSGLTIANSGYGTIPTSGGGSLSVLHTAGGALENSGTLTLNGCTLSGNRAVEGGAIYNAGTLTIGAGCLLANNSATSFGGAIYNTGKATLSGATLTGNVCKGPDYDEGNGGAIANFGSSLALSGCTLTNNSAG